MGVDRRLAAALVLLVWWGPVLRSVAQSPQEIFAVHKDTLLEPGVREAGGFVFATQVNENQRRADQASPGAIRRMLQWKIEKSAGWSMPDSAVRRAALFTAPACLTATLDASTFERVSVVGRPDDTVVTVHALHADKLKNVQLSVADLLVCLRARIASGRGTVLDALLIAELDSAGVSPSEFGAWLDGLCGPGFAATRAGQWPSRPEGLADWRAAADRAIEDGQPLSSAFNPLPSPYCDKFIDAVDCLLLLGRRANDINLLNRARSLLISQGWLRSAAMLAYRGAACGGLADPGASRLSTELRHWIATSNPYVQLLLSDGTAQVPMSEVPSQSYEDARIAFNQATPDSLQRAASLLARSFARSPDVPTAVLLSATLLALDDPALAFPIARLAFLQSPAHPYAGVNMLRAAKACGRRDTAASLVGDVRSKAVLDSWGSSQLAEIESWVATSLAQPASSP